LIRHRESVTALRTINKLGLFFVKQGTST